MHPGCGRSRRQAEVASRRQRRRGRRWLDEAEAKRMLADAGIAVPARSHRRRREGVSPRRARARAAGGAEALLGRAAAQERRRGARPGPGRRGRGSRRPPPAHRLPRGRRRPGLVERDGRARRRAARRGPRHGVVPALVVGFGGIWTEALDDVAIVPLPARPERVEQAMRSLRGAPLLTGGRGRAAVDLDAGARIASPRGSCCSSAIWRCWSSTRWRSTRRLRRARRHHPHRREVGRLSQAQAGAGRPDIVSAAWDWVRTPL